MAKYWKTKYGTKIPLTDMSDKHLLNAIKRLERFENNLRWNIIKHGDEVLSTMGGEIAREMVEDQIDSLLEDNEDSPDLFEEYCPVYYDLVSEAQDRGLL